MSESVDAVAQDFLEMLHDAAGTHTAILSGIQLFGERVIEVTSTATNPEATLLNGPGDPNDPVTRAFATWKIGDLPARLGEGGSVAAAASQQWVVYVYTQWEHAFRPRFAAAFGVSTAEVREPLMGDIRLMRTMSCTTAGSPRRQTPGSASS